MAQGQGALLKSAAREAQLWAVIARPHLARLIAPAARDWLQAVMAPAEPVGIDDLVVACRDPTDDKFLELAVNGRADTIVSGDADLLVLNPFRGIAIVPPALFIQSAAR
jgi:uncharacterized protein